MRLAFQVLLHALAVFAGFWLASGEGKAPVERPGAAVPGAGGKKAQAVEALPVRSLAEARVQELSPDTWPEEIAKISQMSLSELPDALSRYLSCRFPDVRRRLIGLLFERWAVLDRNGALAALQGISSPQMKARALDAILKEWVKVDEAAAWQHIVSMESDPVLQELGIESLLTLCAGKSPTNYVSWARRLEDPFLRGRALDSIAQAWARQDPQGALEAAFAESDPHLRHQLFKRALPRDNSSIQFSQALDRILQLPDPAECVRVMNDWIPIFANIQPSAALKWLQQHAGRAELQQASGVIGSVMAAQSKNVSDLHAAALSLPTGPMRDAFAASAAGSWAGRGHPIPEAEALLALCGPCIERERAVAAIDEAKMRR